MSLSINAIEQRDLGSSRLMVFFDDSFPMVRFFIAFGQGAGGDEPGEGGATRLMMELLLRGTEKKSRKEFGRALETLGSSVDVGVGQELCFISGTALARHLPQTLALVTEALTSPLFAEAELTQLIAQTCQGLISERDDDDAVADIFLRRALYPGHLLGRSPLGSIAELNKMGPAAIHAAYKRVMGAPLVVGFAGHIRVGDAERLIAPLAEHLHGPRGSEVLAAEPHRPRDARIVVVDKPERTQVQLRLAQLGLSARHPDVDAFWLGVMAFGGTFTSPLTRAVRDERGWSYFAHADFRRRSGYVTPVTLRSAPSIDDAVKCLALEAEMLAEFASGEIEAQVLEATRDYLLNRSPFEIASAYDLLGPAISLTLLGLPLSRLFDTPERLVKTDLGQVGAAVSRTLAPGAFRAVLVAPAQAVCGSLERAFPGVPIEVKPHTDGLRDT